MLVDDKLAKEKLIHEIDILGNVYAVAKITIMNLIRNTDLTDCQQPTQRVVWLIEKDSPAKWLRSGWLECTADESWTTNAHDAVSFYDKKDAEEYVAYWYRNVLERDRPAVTEHMLL